MLSDVQVERYCRQIILPEVGSVGQQRLLESAVSLAGDGDAAFLCASYLAGAGVGTLEIPRWRSPGPQARAFGVRETPASLAEALARRNPDCRIATEPIEASLTVILGDAFPPRLSPGAWTVWGSSEGACIRLARCAPGEACLDCLRAVATAHRDESEPALLGSLAALEALRLLLGLVPSLPAGLFTFDFVRGTASTSTFPSRQGCARCRP